MIFDEYAQVWRAHRVKYGDGVIVLMEVGSFYEMYSDGDIVMPDIRTVCEALNIVLTKKNKTIADVSRTNPMLAGFPSVALTKYLPVLIDAGYTIVMVEQVTSPPNPRREVTRVLSRTTYVDDRRDSVGPLMSLYVDRDRKGTVFVGAAVLDLATGRCFLGQFLSSMTDRERALDDVYRVVSIHRPAEVVIMSTKSDDFGLCRRRLDLDAIGATCFDRTGGVFDAEIVDTVYQAALFRKAHKSSRTDDGMMGPHEWLGVERAPWTACAYAGVLQFAHQHDETIVQRLEMPRPFDTPGSLTVCYNTLRQLGITATRGGKSLLTTMNRCCTAMGRREFEDRLLNPCAGIETLTARYDAVAKVLDCGLYSKVRKSLNGVSDLQRLWRKATTRKARPCDVVSIGQSIDIVAGLMDECPDEMLVSVTKTRARDALKAVINGANQVDNDNPVSIHVFRRGVYPDLDAIRDSFDTAMMKLEAVAKAVNGKVETSGEGNNPSVTTTQKRLREAIASRPEEQPIPGMRLADVTGVSAAGNVCRLHHILLAEACETTGTARRDLERTSGRLFDAFIVDLAERHDKDMAEIVRCVADLDVHATCAQNADEYRHRRPLLDDVHGASYVDAKGLRHPVIERVVEAVRYVPNDMSIGGDDSKGVLLYGLNAAGKTSLAKAIAVNVVLAQAGMFVAADAFVLRPYRQVMSRITQGDDIINGLSTFTVEMTELRNVLLRADENTLVVADELCAGTEHRSAVAIVAAGVEALAKRGTSFVMATHLHELPEVPEVKDLGDRIRTYHLAVGVDPCTGKLSYERRLLPGTGPDTYGVEVCRGLHLPPEFVLAAQKVRHRLMGISGDLVRVKARSRYNRKVIVDTCDGCGQRAASEVHHIVPQAEADAEGFVGHFHKNARHNLVALCSACHDERHGVSSRTTVSPSASIAGSVAKKAFGAG